MSERFGVIDVGTLKVKLQIVERDNDGGLRTIEQSNILTCLGCRMGENGGKPKPENIEKVIAELTRCKKLIRNYQVNKTRIVSTHALREMGSTGSEIAELIKKRTGLTIEIISQQEEANLFYQAVIGDFQTDEDFTIIDMGGGSAQILVGNKKKLKNSFLLKTGTSTLWDKFTAGNTGKDHPSRQQLSGMKDYILKELQPVPKNLHTPVIWGSSCIIDVFKGIRLPLEEYSSSLSHPYKTPVYNLENFYRKVIHIPLDTREEMFVSPTTRYMWGIDMALLNVIELAKKVGAKFVIPSNANINQGLLLSLVD